MNLLIDRYFHELGDVGVGPETSTVRIAPKWDGASPLEVAVRIDRVRGLDIVPVDVRDAAARERLIAYTWADAPERAARIEAAAAMIADRPVDLVQGDAADWIEARLAEPQAVDTCRVVMHPIVWRYLGAARQAHVADAIAAAGMAAGPERPLAWVRMEPGTPRTHFFLDVTTWPGGKKRRLASTQPHGVTIEWLA